MSGLAGAASLRGEPRQISKARSSVRASLVRIVRLGSAARVGDEPAELHDVELVPAHSQLVAERAGRHEVAIVGRQAAPQAGDEVLQLLLRGRGRLGPQHVDEPIGRDEPIGAEDEHREDQALAAAAERHLCPAVGEDLDRPEHPKCTVIDTRRRT